MIKVIKHGATEFTGKCRSCGCEFTYELSDRNAADYIKCPDCEDYHAWQHPNQSQSQMFGWSETVSPCVIGSEDRFFVPVDNGGVKPV